MSRVDDRYGGKDDHYLRSLLLEKKKKMLSTQFCFIIGLINVFAACMSRKIDEDEEENG